jgi:transcriptional regulator with XRE-family HTH domain
MKKIVGDNLKSWRKKFGYTQDTLADYLGIKRENISFYETGEREIPVIHLEKLSDLFGIEPEMFFVESKELTQTELAFAFRNTEHLSTDSLRNVAMFKKIVKNYIMMKSKIK